MKLLIVGSRDIDGIDISEYIPENVELIISGGAVGIDSLAEKYADEHRISKLILRPNYKFFGRGAPIRRNREMVDIADSVLIFWNGHSKGTKSTIDYASRLKKEIRVVTFDTAEQLT